MKSSTLLILVPAAVVAALLAAANRETVAFKLVPFAEGEAAFPLVMPLFLLVFFSFLFGVLVGGATVGLRNWRNTRRKRLAARDIEKAVALDKGKAPVE